MHDFDGSFFDFHDERLIFFCRGVLETVRKLGWPPDVVHCHGWMSSLVPMYLKKAFADDPIFFDTKVVYSVYNQSIEQYIKQTVNHSLSQPFKHSTKANQITSNTQSIEHSISQSINQSISQLNQLNEPCN